MWRRVSSQLKTLAPSWRSTALNIPRSNGARLIRNPSFLASPSFPFSTSVSVDTSVGTKKVEDIMPIATGHEREELEAELQGQKRFDMDTPVGPFGTKVCVSFTFSGYIVMTKWWESPAIVKSYYDKRIVGCPGGEGEDEHDVVWFWLEKDKPFECSVCSQYFKLEVVGEGGPPDGHGDDHH
ncbi:putative cytochrome c oxidase subunit 5b-like protein [Cinnamomum micranthum f. kanehirae]|uniref:Putative cytochrome c oxidase subunit 5b-like protein n=1 Tax=Cinnamomum micranthum f. kanehirae TaxID=337451 RepID=A0A443NX69_9MAGN|nr:putative cytochrome c oxidase subunit 5b-like protein [Cinnamomum micranthum f. kanehirae]